MPSSRGPKDAAKVEPTDERSGESCDDAVDYVDVGDVARWTDGAGLETMPIAELRNLMLTMAEDLEFEAAQLRRRLTQLEQELKTDCYH